MVTTVQEQAFAKIPDNAKLPLHYHQGWHYQHNQYIHRAGSAFVTSDIPGNARLRGFFFDVFLSDLLTSSNVAYKSSINIIKKTHLQLQELFFSST